MEMFATYAGIKPYLESEDHEFGNDFCGDPMQFAEELDCTTKYFDLEGALSEFNRICSHEQICKFNLWDYFKEVAEDVEDEYCLNDFTYLYLQYSCTHAHDSAIIYK